MRLRARRPEEKTPWKRKKQPLTVVSRLIDLEDEVAMCLRFRQCMEEDLYVIHGEK